MSYKYYQQRTKPIACFLMGDISSPYSDISGNAQVANTKSGSTLAPLGAPLVAGAANSSVFDSSHVGEFTANFFQQGLEQRNWAIAAWILPSQLSSDNASLRTNVYTNPSFENTALPNTTMSTALAANGGTKTSSTTHAFAGSACMKSSCTASGLDTYITLSSISGIFASTQYTASAYIWVETITGAAVSNSCMWAGNQSGSGYTATFDLPSTHTTGQWVRHSITFTTGASDTGIQIRLYVPKGTVYWDGVLIEQVGSPKSYFDGSFSGALWTGTANQSTSQFPPSQSEQSILSHTGQTDGLTINGNIVRFSTDYLTNGSAALTYDLQILRKAFVVAQHSVSHNELWVDGVLVGSIPVTNEQMNDKFVSTTNKLYCGTTTSLQKVALGGVAFYNSLTSEDILALYNAGNDVVTQDRIAPQFNGNTYDLNRDMGSYYVDITWETTGDLSLGEINNVSIYGDEITPIYDATQTSINGTWKTSVPLDSTGATSIYGVALQWSGSGVDVDVSLDGTTWTSATSGQLVSIVTSGMNPTGKDMSIRVTIDGGIVNDPAYLDSIRVIGFLDNTFANGMGRTITVSSPAVLREDYEPAFYRDDNGVSLHGGSLTIGLDTSAEPKATRTLEAWVKPISGVPTFSITGTQYRNGVTDSTLPLGQWSLVHIVAASDLASSIVISGDVIVGQVSIYPTALTAGNVFYIWQSYTGKPVVSFSDSSATTVTEPATPVLIYAHDWSVDGGGG